MPNFLTPSALVESATKWLRDALLGADRLQRPIARRGGVGHGLEGGEGFRRDHEQRLVRIESAVALAKSAPSTLAMKRNVDVRITEFTQRAPRHLRSEIGAADADVDDIADALAGMAFPGAGADLIGEGGHPVEDLVHFRHDILAVDQNFLIPLCPEGDVQDGAILGYVDLLAGKHGVAMRLDLTSFGEREKLAHRVVGDAVL